MDSSPGLYRCASPNLAHFLRSSISLVTFFVVVCTRTFFVVRTCRARGGRGDGVSAAEHRAPGTRARARPGESARGTNGSTSGWTPAVAPLFRVGRGARRAIAHLGAVFLLPVLDDRLHAVRVGTDHLRKSNTKGNAAGQSRAGGRGGCWLSRGRTVGGGVRDDDRWWRGRAPAPPEARPRSLRRHRARRSPPNASCPPLWRTSQLAACAARVKEGGATPVVLASCDRIGAIKGLLNPEKRAAGPGGDDTSQEGSAESRTSIRVASVMRRSS